MSNVLVATWDGGGNVPPATGIAAELHRRGDTVRVMGQPQQRQSIEANGLRFEPYSHPLEWSSTTPKSRLRWITSLRALAQNPGLGADVSRPFDASQRTSCSSTVCCSQS